MRWMKTLAVLALLLSGGEAWASSASVAVSPAEISLTTLSGKDVSSSHRFQLTAAEVDEVLASQEEVAPDWDAVQARQAPRRWWPLAMSAVLPGLGEAVTGHVRGYVFMAADLAAIGGSIYYDQQGDDKQKEYIAFADAHWSQDDWTDAIENYDQAPWFGTDYQSIEEVPLWVRKEDDPREYYENLGKWDIFWYGWEDSKPRSIGDTDITWDWMHPPENFMTPLRDQYLNMRTESNDDYSKRDTLHSVSLILRVLSVVQVAYLEGFIGGRYKSDYEGPGVGGSLAHLEESHGAQVNWFVDAGNIQNARLGLQVRY